MNSKPAQEMSDSAKPPAGLEESRRHGLPLPPASLASAAQQKAGTLVSTGLLKGTQHMASVSGEVRNHGGWWLHTSCDHQLCVSPPPASVLSFRPVNLNGWIYPPCSACYPAATTAYISYCTLPLHPLLLAVRRWWWCAIWADTEWYIADVSIHR